VKFLVLIAIVAVLGATGAIKFEFFAVSSGPPPAIRDALAIAAAADSTQADEAAGGVFELLHVAIAAGRARGSRLIRQQLPPLAAQIDADAPVARGRVLGVYVKTPVGLSCRTAVSRLMAQEQWLVRTFADDVARSPSTPTAVRRFNARWQALGRWWGAEVTACAAGAAPAERADVEATMHSL
jgi:hypothetical protein